ncbi:mycothiol acetyltransferase-like [Aplysia californica]|uniref:Mycothiol acetyltransferase-like n=1 Tax=Aplysia californica TaxID=6500 RepID=A0ABM1VZE0_APLCA|nr:mycothiol acetyltransferase-like [Aplysia californica]
MLMRYGCIAVLCLYCLGYSSGAFHKVPPGMCYISEIAVDAKFQGRGVGQALLDLADTEARSKNCHASYLYVAGNNRAKKLYERVGYVESGKKEGLLVTLSSGVNLYYLMKKQL